MAAALTYIHTQSYTCVKYTISFTCSTFDFSSGNFEIDRSLSMPSICMMNTCTQWNSIHACRLKRSKYQWCYAWSLHCYHYRGKWYNYSTESPPLLLMVGWLKGQQWPRWSSCLRSVQSPESEPETAWVHGMGTHTCTIVLIIYRHRTHNTTNNSPV